MNAGDVALHHAGAQVAGLPAIVPSLDPSALHREQLLALVGGEVGAVACQREQPVNLAVQRRELVVLAHQLGGRTVRLGAVERRRGGERRPAKQQSRH